MATWRLHQVRRPSPRWPPAEEEGAARGGVGGRGGSGATTFTSAHNDSLPAPLAAATTTTVDATVAAKRRRRRRPRRSAAPVAAEWNPHAGGSSKPPPAAEEEETMTPLLIEVPSQVIDGFDCVGGGGDATATATLSEQSKELEMLGKEKDVVISIPALVYAPRSVSVSAAYEQEGAHIPYSVSLSMPASPSGFHFSQFGMAAAKAKAVHRDDARVAPAETRFDDAHPPAVGRVEAHSPRLLMKQTWFHSQPILHLSKNDETTRRCDSTRDKRFDQFKTFSGRLERQLCTLRGRPAQEHMTNGEGAPEPNIAEEETEQVPGADRYFDALEGPELETLRATETTVQTKDEKWPFLLRFPISAFGMCLGVSSQAILWKTLTSFLHVSPVVNHVLWWIALALMGLVFFIYLLKVMFYFEVVRREFYHPIHANFFSAPWIACLFLVQGVHRAVTKVHHGVWYALMTPWRRRRHRGRGSVGAATGGGGNDEAGVGRGAPLALTGKRKRLVGYGP
uniref:Uncharacterized protein n=1 Tax=Oryza meridionalis TaxID=40149 RepID=A0A0E0EY55_9ORYZ